MKENGGEGKKKELSFPPKNGATKARKRASIANCRGVRLRLLRRRQLNACLPVYRRNTKKKGTAFHRTRENRRVHFCFLEIGGR